MWMVVHKLLAGALQAVIMNDPYKSPENFFFLPLCSSWRSCTAGRGYCTSPCQTWHLKAWQIALCCCASHGSAVCKSMKRVSILFFALYRIAWFIRTPTCFLNLSGTCVALPGSISPHAAGTYREVTLLIYCGKISISIKVWSHSWFM